MHSTCNNLVITTHPHKSLVWEYRKITGLSWISRTGWGVATKSVDGVGPTSTYFISDTLHDLIRACTPNTKPLRSTQQAAIAAGAPDG